MQGCSLSNGRVANKKADAAMKGNRWAFPGVNNSITHHALPFEHVFGSLFVRERASVFIESAVVYVASEDSSGELGGVACSRVQCHRGNFEKVRHFPS